MDELEKKLKELHALHEEQKLLMEEIKTMVKSIKHVEGWDE